MQGELQKELHKLGNKQLDVLQASFINHFEAAYDEIALIDNRGLFNSIDTRAAQQVINQVWCADGKSWSSRIWKNIDNLQQTLNDNLMDCVITGKSSDQLKEILQIQFNVSYNMADSVVRTELAHIQTQAAKQRYQDIGVKQVEILADEDERRCEICGKLHGKRYSIHEELPIPAHPRCRCSIIPVIESIDKEDEKPTELTKENYNGKILYSDQDLDNITQAIQTINPNIGTAINYVHTTLASEGVHGAERLAERNITLKDAQSYIDNAIICFKQGKDKVLYLSEEGVCVAILKNGGISTAYPKSWFDERTIEILKAVKKNGK